MRWIVCILQVKQACLTPQPWNVTVDSQVKLSEFGTNPSFPQPWTLGEGGEEVFPFSQALPNFPLPNWVGVENKSRSLRSTKGGALFSMFSALHFVAFGLPENLFVVENTNGPPQQSAVGSSEHEKGIKLYHTCRLGKCSPCLITLCSNPEKPYLDVQAT